MQKNWVFVYGTLKSGYGNNRLLNDSRYVGPAYTLDKFGLQDGAYPYMVNGEWPEKGHIWGQVWEVDEGTLGRLDQLEGVANNHYNRIETRVMIGSDTPTVWAYVASEDTKHFLSRNIRSCKINKEGFLEWKR